MLGLWNGNWKGVWFCCPVNCWYHCSWGCWYGCKTSWHWFCCSSSSCCCCNCCCNCCRKAGCIATFPVKSNQFWPGIAAIGNAAWGWAIKEDAANGFCKVLNFASLDSLVLQIYACCEARFFWCAAFATFDRFNVLSFARWVMNHWQRTWGVLAFQFSMPATQARLRRNFAIVFFPTTTSLLNKTFGNLDLIKLLWPRLLAI